MTEYQESTSITFEWTVKGLKNLFDSSRGDNKSRVTRSVRFGGGKWQILFYANSGDGNFVSLYLNCEPTLEEKEGAPNGKWVREGQFKFSFELRNSSKSILFNMKEACDHVFSYKTQNWGWAQFAKRDAVYYGASSVRQSDSFVITCTITSSPSVPVNPSKIRKRAVPLAMLDVVGSLLDDPTYSDIEFVFPNKRVADSRAGRNECQRIWACKKLLNRADYFNSMFNSGFMENSSEPVPQPNRSQSQDESFSPQHHLMEDSDLEDEAAEAETTSLVGDEENEAMAEVEEFATPSDEQNSQLPAGDTPNVTRRSDDSEEMEDVQGSGDATADEGQGATSGQSNRIGNSSLVQSEHSNDTFNSSQMGNSRQDVTLGPPKSRVVVRDVAYSTYRAVLYYLYTDSIIFAPLASSFLHKTKKHARTSSQRANADPPSDTPRDGEESMSSIRPGLSRRATQPLTQMGEGTTNGVSLSSSTTRAQWIKAWEYENPGRPLPCSAKAVYRLADKLDLAELKERAREHIIKSLTVANVPHEVFSSFSAAFEDIRKVQMDYFLANWGEIRGSEAMSGVWQQIRNGRHPGFEEVWPLIASNLEYRASSEGTVGDERDVMPTE